MRITGQAARDLAARFNMSAPAPKRTRTGRGVRRDPGDMNGLERAYADHLEVRRLAGEVAEYHFNVVKLRLARKTFYDTDFLVMLANGDIEIHEVKGFMEDDAACKLKVAADRFPFRFLLVKRPKKNGPWEIKEVGTVKERVNG